LRLGTTTDRIYIEDENTKFNGGVMVNNIGPKTEDGRGVTLNVEGSNDKHLVTKKYVDDAVQSGVEGTDLSGLVPLDGSKTMTGTLTAPRVNVKTDDFGDGVLLVEGKRDNTNNVAARVTFSNSQNANAYGSIEWYATTGSNGAFKFTNKIKLLEEGTADNDAVTKKYVDDKVQSGVDGIDFPEPDLSEYVSTVDGDQSMLGPLEIHSLGGWKASRVKLQYVTSKADNEALQLGTPSSEDTLRVYEDKVNVKGPYPLQVREIKGANGTGGTIYTGDYTDDDHIATKKDVLSAVQNIDTGGGFTPGDQVAKVGSSSNNVGSFWVVDGALYCKVS
jgi:hypothetical protein